MAIFTHDIVGELRRFLPANPDEPVFVFTDSVTESLCLPRLKALEQFHTIQIINVGQGEQCKTIETAVQLWTTLQERRATRRSLIINLGGGMVTDLGGFVAATYKRGMRCVNVPTTLLGTVDAASGGKTGVNFGGLKNEVGTVRKPEAVLVDVEFFRTLDAENLLSGYAEMLKHALLANDDLLRETLCFDLYNVDYQLLADLVEKNLAVKQRFVDADPTERGVRKALNFGHTFGHAFEALSQRTKLAMLHGKAVAFGLVCELFLSHILLGFPKKYLTAIHAFVKENYGRLPFDCNHYEALYELMRHDKKNEANSVNFTLLRQVGDVLIDQTATKELIFETLDFLREM